MNKPPPPPPPPPSIRDYSAAIYAVMYPYYNNYIESTSTILTPENLIYIHVYTYNEHILFLYSVVFGPLLISLGLYP